MDWQNLYVKREVDQRLMKLWEAAKSGKPQFAVLLAETGWGKTRAIQHFYEQLRQEEDLHGYYPETLTDERDSATPRRSAVNPNLRQSEATADQIPYLWWGIRFSCDAHAGGISAYRDALAPHLLAVALKQRMSGMSEEEKRAWRELGAELVSKGVETVVEIAFGPILLLIKAGARVENIRRYWNQRRQLRAAPQPTPADASQQARESLADQITEAFRAILNPTEKRYPTVPVVIAMDDAHWADPDSLEVIRKIWELAVVNGWQLLIIATHWMGDYRRYQNRDREADKTLRLPDLHRPDRYRYIWHEIDLSENADLRAITRAAFPRMHESQVQEFTNITQGHPLYLRELILEAKKHPSWFVNRDTDGNLTPAGLRLSQQFRGLHELARSRFDSQPEPVRTILAWGSRQGMQFLHCLTRAHAEDQSFQPCYNRTEHDEAIRQAREDAILDALPEVEGSEFDQIAYQKAAEEYLNNEPNRVKRAFKRSLCNTLKAYIQNGLAGVPPAEQTLLLSIAAKELRPRGAPRVDEPNWQVWARAVYMLFQRLRQELRWIQAEAVALQLVPKNLPAEGWSFDALDFWEQHDLFLFLRMFSELQAAGRLANALRLRTEPTAKASRAQAEALKRYAVALVCVGDVWAAQLQWQDALACYQESLQIRRQIVAEFGETPESLRDLSVSLDRVGDVWAAQLQWQDALACYQESLQVFRQIVAEFGETPESLRDLSVSLDRVGDVWAAQLQWQDALACYQESLQIRRQIVAEFGETPESLRDLSVSLNKVGDVWAAQRQWQDALACYQESLQVCRQIVAEFGETPESLRDLSVSLNKVGDVWAAQLQWQDALACYQESLQVCRQIVAEFGKTPESLRDLSVSLDRVGDVHRAQLQWQDALACYQESLQVRRQIVAEFGETPASLRDLSVSLDRVGDVHRAQLQWQDALACYQESLQVCRQIVAEFGETPESLRDLSVSLNKVGDVWAAQLQWQDALACYQESLQIRRQIVAEFGETPESLRDLSVSLNKVGDVHRAQLQWQDALACYQESLQVCRQIVAEFGETPESLRDLSVSLDRVGDVWAAQLQWQDALACYQESLQVRRQIVAEFGKTPESLRALSVSLNKVGDVWAAQRQWQDALACYQESLQIRRQIVAEFGETPESLRDLSVSLNKVGDVWAAQLQWQDALACYQESLQVCRQIVAEFGETPESLRDLSVSLNKVGDVHRAQLQWQDALACYQESLQVFRQIVAEFGETPESLRDLSVSLNKVGDVHRAQLQWQDALACYQESLQVCRQIVAEFGKTPASLRDLSVSLERVGDVHRAQLQWQDALACYQESLQVRRQIVAEFGETPESLRDLLVSHAKMALALSGMGNRPLACKHALVALQLATALLENHPDDPLTQEDYRNAQILVARCCGSMPFGVR